MALTKIKLNELTPKADPILADSIVISDSENSGKGALVEITDLQTLIGGGGGGGAVDSVAGKTGVVTLDADDVDPTASKLWMSDTQAAKLTGIAENANNYTHPETHPQSMIEGLATALAAKAPLASPALTGTPTAPTAATGTNTTQLATTAFVQAKNADWEMIIGRKHFDDSGTGTEGAIISRYNIQTVRSNYGIIPLSTAGTSTLFIGGPSNKYASLNLENAGVVSATTPAPGTNNTRIATTAFVQNALAGALSLKGTPSELTATEMNTTKLAKDALTAALLTEGTPSGPTATGTKGTVQFDADYFYVCTATNTWVRFPKDGAWTVDNDESAL